MNTDLLTFFSPRESRGGIIQIFTVEIGKGPEIEILVYSPERVDLSRPAAFSVASDKDYLALVNEIKALLAPGGGILAELQSHNGLTRTALTIFKSLGFKSPQKMLRLSPAGSPRFETIPESVDVPMGDHLVVPVTAEAEERLASFYEKLHGFPADLESSILNVIRRPSLEWRIERIERVLNRPAATWKEEQRSRARGGTFLEKLLRIVMRPIPVGPAIAAALLLTAGTLAAYDNLFDSGEKPKETEATPKVSNANTAAASTQENGEDPDPEEQEEPVHKDVDKSLGNLFTALQENRELEKLYKSHFDTHQDKPFEDSSPVALGIAKLQAVQLGLIKNDDAMLADQQLQAGTKSIYASDAGNKALAKNENTLELLAWSSCQRFGKPELPKTNTAPKAALIWATGRDCNHLKIENAAAGLDTLTDWVKDQDRGLSWLP
jgi:hypothetical protein